MAHLALEEKEHDAWCALNSEHVICFVEGTAIRTPSGDRPIESLVEGDLVVTIDGESQPIRWIGRKTLRASGKLAPICFSKGALGNYRDLLVSPHHRVLQPGASEQLVPAQNLVDNFGVTVTYGGMVTYIHLLFERHQMLIANGAASESFYPDDRALKSITRGSREDLFTKFPELRTDLGAYGPICRPTAELSQMLTV